MNFLDFVDKHPTFSLIVFVISAIVIYDAIANICNVLMRRKK